MKHYSAQVEGRMKTLYRSLSEKDRRRYAAVEVDKLGYGGAEYISSLFGIDPKTIRHGLADLDEPGEPAERRIRKRAAAANGRSTLRPSFTASFRKWSPNIRRAIPSREYAGRI
jgi:hypothetical protein